MSKITIEQDAVGRYRISIGIGKRYSTRSLDEVKIAIEHYWDLTHKGMGSDPQCPLCRAINEEMVKMRSGVRPESKGQAEIGE